MNERHSARSVLIGDRPVGPDHPPLVVAEVSGNHNGDLERALDIIDAVAAAGAEAVKFQTYTADTLTVDVHRPEFRISSEHPLWGGRTLYDLYGQAFTPWDWHKSLFERARSLGMIPLSSPFDKSAVDLLADLDSPAYKIASLEIGDIKLLEEVAGKGKPVIVSTGAASLAEIDTAIHTIRECGNDQIVVLGCTSSYPSPPSESNLRSIPTLAAAFQSVVGLSDHTKGIGVSLASVGLGASLIERHVTLLRSDGGVDSDFSLEPAELAVLIEATRSGWEALGTEEIRFTPSEAESRRLRRSLFVVADVVAGDVVTPDNVRSIRPSGGLAPSHLPSVLGRTFARSVARGTPLSWDLI